MRVHFFREMFFKINIISFITSFCSVSQQKLLFCYCHPTLLLINRKLGKVNISSITTKWYDVLLQQIFLFNIYILSCKKVVARLLFKEHNSESLIKISMEGLRVQICKTNQGVSFLAWAALCWFAELFAGLLFRYQASKFCLGSNGPLSSCSSRLAASGAC